MKILDKLRTRAAERLAELEGQLGDADKNVKPVTTANPYRDCILTRSRTRF